MGKYLQIRVSASTFRPEDVEKAWPRLWKTAWPQPRVGPDIVDPAPRGVLELVAELRDLMEVGDPDPKIRTALESILPQAVRLKASLEEALAGWDPTKANGLSDQLEEALADMEKALA